MISTARSFGAPVIDPPGSVARRICSSGSPSFVTARTVDTRWCTVGSVNMRAKPSTVTEPVAATRPRSLRNRSTIIKCSAASFADPRSASASRASSAASPPRRRVPLIGRVSTLPGRTRRNDSGELHKIVVEPDTR